MSRARDLSRLANSNAFSVDTNLNVGIGTTTPASKLDVSGTINASSDVQINGKSAATTGKSIAMSMIFG